MKPTLLVVVIFYGKEHNSRGENRVIFKVLLIAWVHFWKTTFLIVHCEDIKSLNPLQQWFMDTIHMMQYLSLVQGSQCWDLFYILCWLEEPQWNMKQGGRTVIKWFERMRVERSPGNRECGSSLSLSATGCAQTWQLSSAHYLGWKWD